MKKEKSLYAINFIFEDGTDVEYQIYTNNPENESKQYQKIFEEKPKKIVISKYKK